MKKILSLFSLAALTVGLLGSCSKINERLDNLEKKVSGIENEQIASINSQIDGIKTSIADLGTIRSDISSLKQSASDHSVDIFNLEEADRALKDRILNLEEYVDAVLPNYAEKEWVEATFSTLEQYEATCDTIAKIDARIGALDAKLSKDIKACADSLTKWVNKTFEGYYTAAQMDAKLAQMKSAIDSSKASGKISDAKADSIATELTNAKAAVDTAKANIRAEYRAAIDTAIKASEGKLTKELTDAITTVNGKIESLVTRVDNLAAAVADLTGRVKKLEGMIQSVTIVPAYSDGSVRAEDDTLYLDCIIGPASTVSSLTKTNFTVLVNKVLTKAVNIETINITDDKWFSKNPSNGTVSLKIPVKNYIPTSDDSTITVAVKVNYVHSANLASDYTTEFVPVTVAAAKPIVEYVEIGGLKWATKNLGATTVAGSYTTCYGDLYQWGSVNTLYDGFPWTTATTGSFTWKTGKEGGFVEANREYTGTDATLPNANDVVKQTIGGGWRMPTSAEFKALYDACLNGSYDKTTNPSGASASVGKGVYWCTNYDGVAGCLFCDGTNKLFFPAAGNGTGTSLGGAGSSGVYWSSSLYTGNTFSAYYLTFYSSGVFPQFSNYRYYGYSVRPVKAAASTKGTAKATIGGSEVDVNWVQLWENGPKFAEYNVGVTDGKAESYGGYYCWGKSVDKDPNGDYNDGTVVLSGDDDTATNLWGGNWRMPTQTELEALINPTNCDVAWTDNYNGTGIKGRIYTGKGAYASNSVFLPAAGSCSSGSVSGQGSSGYYWSSTPDDSNWAYYLYFHSSGQESNGSHKKFGNSVRAVLAE